MRASEYEVNPESYTKAFGVYLLYQDITHYKEKKRKNRQRHFISSPFNSMSTSIQSPDKYDNRQSKVPAAPSPTPEPETVPSLEE